jgi:hypothetical protein
MRDPVRWARETEARQAEVEETAAGHAQFARYALDSVRLFYFQHRT